MRKKRTKPPIPHAGKSVKNSFTSPKMIERAKRQAEAMDYRVQGYSYPQIAEALNVSVSTAYKYVDDAISEITYEKAQQVLQMELKRLDAMQAAIFANALAGDINAINAVVKLMYERRQLLGYGAQAKGTLSLVSGLGENPNQPVTGIQLSFVNPKTNGQATNGHATNGHATNGHGDGE